MRAAFSLNEIHHNDHVFEVVDGDNDVLYQNDFVATARTPLGGQRIYLSRDNIANIISCEDPNSVPHEAGHSLGCYTLSRRREHGDGALPSKNWTSPARITNQILCTPLIT